MKYLISLIFLGISLALNAQSDESLVPPEKKDPFQINVLPVKYVASKQLNTYNAYLVSLVNYEQDLLKLQADNQVKLENMLNLISESTGQGIQAPFNCSEDEINALPGQNKAEIKESLIREVEKVCEQKPIIEQNISNLRTGSEKFRGIRESFINQTVTEDRKFYRVTNYDENGQPIIKDDDDFFNQNLEENCQAESRYCEQSLPFPKEGNITVAPLDCKNIMRRNGEEWKTSVDMKCINNKPTIIAGKYHIPPIAKCSIKEMQAGEIRWEKVEYVSSKDDDQKKSVAGFNVLYCFNDIIYLVDRPKYRPISCESVGKPLDRVWWHTGGETEVTCNMSICDNVNGGTKKRKIEYAWACDQFENVIPYKNSGRQNDLKDPTQKVRTYLLGTAMGLQSARLGRWTTQPCKSVDAKKLEADFCRGATPPETAARPTCPASVTDPTLSTFNTVATASDRTALQVLGPNYIVLKNQGACPSEREVQTATEPASRCGPVGTKYDLCSNVCRTQCTNEPILFPAPNDEPYIVNDTPQIYTDQIFRTQETF